MKFYLITAVAITGLSAMAQAADLADCRVLVRCSDNKEYRMSSTMPEPKPVEGNPSIKKCALQENDKIMCEKMCKHLKAEPTTTCEIRQLFPGLTGGESIQPAKPAGTVLPYTGQEGGFRKPQ